MDVHIIDPSDGIYESGPDYVHALEVRRPGRFLFVSGTMGLEPSGEPVPGLSAQLECIWANLRRILAEADMSVDNIVRLTSYLRDPSFAEANAAARVTALGARRIPTTAIVAQTLTEDWLVEIEIVAAA